MMNENKEIYDCVIVGGSRRLSGTPFGQGRGVLVCDKGNPQHPHVFFHATASATELLNIGRDQLKPYKASISSNRRQGNQTIRNNLKLCSRMAR